MKKLFYFLNAVLLTTYTLAQTTNEGMLYIGSGTTVSTVSTLDNKENGVFINDGELYLYKNISNSGLFDFYLFSGITKLHGFQEQEISAIRPIHVQNISFKNQSDVAPFKLTGNLLINGETFFTEGIVNNRQTAGQVIFNSQATHFETSNKSFVNGYVEKIGDEDFVFPIGDQEYYRSAIISEIYDTNSHVIARYSYSSTNANFPLDLKEDGIAAIDADEYWEIKNEGNTSSGFLLGLTWQDGVTPEAFLEAAEHGNLIIVRWDPIQNKWIDEGGIIDTNKQTVTTLIDEFGIFTLGQRKEEEMECQITVYNALTPNGDGRNDYFRIDKEGTECPEKLTVSIFNRWGVKVFDSQDYGRDGEIFTGISNGRATMDKGKQLPSGTYYYILEYSKKENPVRHKEAGYLYISGNKT